MFAKCKISDCGDFAAFAGVWGVPSQRFRISVKDILKHCWQKLSERSDNGGYRNILLIRNFCYKTDKIDIISVKIPIIN